MGQPEFSRTSGLPSVDLSTGREGNGASESDEEWRPSRRFHCREVCRWNSHRQMGRQDQPVRRFHAVVLKGKIGARRVNSLFWREKGIHPSGPDFCSQVNRDARATACALRDACPSEPQPLSCAPHLGSPASYFPNSRHKTRSAALGPSSDRKGTPEWATTAKPGTQTGARILDIHIRISA